MLVRQTHLCSAADRWGKMCQLLGSRVSLKKGFSINVSLEREGKAFSCSQDGLELQTAQYQIQQLGESRES